MRRDAEFTWRVFWPRVSLLLCRFNRHLPITLGSRDIVCYDCGTRLEQGDQGCLDERPRPRADGESNGPPPRVGTGRAKARP